MSACRYCQRALEAAAALMDVQDLLRRGVSSNEAYLKVSHTAAGVP